MAGLFFIIIPIPMALTTFLMLFIDLGFELLVVLSYAWEPVESRDALMKVPPRQPVTRESIKALRYRKALIEQLEQGRPTLSEGEAAGLSFKLKGAWFDFKNIFTKNYWKLRFQRTHGEQLVDLNVISYGYLEIGMLETLGSLLMFFVAFYYVYGMTPTFLYEASSDPRNYFTVEAPPFEFGGKTFVSP
jgi:hypothetical protein